MLITSCTFNSIILYHVDYVSQIWDGANWSLPGALYLSGANEGGKCGGCVPDSEDYAISATCHGQHNGIFKYLIWGSN